MKHILVVDDDKNARDSLGEILESGGYRVMMAEDGVDALERARLLKPALVIVDGLMPKMGGFKLAGIIKADKGLRDTPVILLTSLAKQEERLEMQKEAGIDVYLEKTSPVSLILETVEKLINEKGNEQKEG